jgi:hypothetical protein
MRRVIRREWLWVPDVEALHEINTVFPQQVLCLGVLDTLGDRLLSKPLGDVDGRLD